MWMRALLTLFIMIFFSTPLMADGQACWDREISQIMSYPGAYDRIMMTHQLKGHHRSCKHPQVERMFGIARYLENSSMFTDPKLKFQKLNYNSNQIRFLENMKTNNIVGGYETTPAVIDSDDQYEEEVPEVEENETQNDRHELYASRSTLDFIEGLSTYTLKRYGLPLTMTALTTNTDHDTDGHCDGHFAGGGFDFRPLPGDHITTLTRENREMNRQMIIELLRRDEVKKIIYNGIPLARDGMPIDREMRDIIAERKSRGRPVQFLHLADHGTHIHVSLYLDPVIERIATKIEACLWPSPKKKMAPHRQNPRRGRATTIISTGAS